MASAHRPCSLSNLVVSKCIGEGTFAKVLLVSDKEDSSQVYAMKVSRKTDMSEDRLQTEQRVLKSVSHPFIVACHQAFETSTRICLLLEYCPGGELFFHLTKSGRFPESTAQFYTAEIALALEYLHDRSIIYRDLKPENILLDASGHVKVADFGIVKEGVRDNHSAKSHCGTPEYYAPEMLRGTGHGRAVDWYSLGAVVFEMLTGLPPFYSKDQDVVFERIRIGKLLFPRCVSSVARDFISSLLAANPDLRLGGGVGDGREVRSHMFFVALNWSALLEKNIEPPFKPTLTGLLDVRYVNDEFTSRKVTTDGIAMLRTQAQTVSGAQRIGIWSSAVSDFRSRLASLLNGVASPRGCAMFDARKMSSDVVESI